MRDHRVALVNVSAIIVTRGDVDMKPILASLPEEWDVIVWDNGAGSVSKRTPWNGLARIVTGKGELPDLSVYGRYAAIEHATGDLIYVQDDDCIVSDPRAIVDQWYESEALIQMEHSPEPWRFVVCNMPQEFRHSFYEEHALVGFGAAFHRDVPNRAWWRFRGGFDETAAWVDFDMDLFHRTCDVIVTGLTPRVLVDVPKDNLPYADDETRMWRQPTHQAERAHMLDLVRSAR